MERVRHTQIARVEDILARAEAKAEAAARRARQGKPDPGPEELTPAQAEVMAVIEDRYRALAAAAEKLAIPLDVFGGRPPSDEALADFLADAPDPDLAVLEVRRALFGVAPPELQKELIELMHRCGESAAPPPPAADPLYQE
jgi:hypothetical protein